MIPPEFCYIICPQCGDEPEVQEVIREKDLPVGYWCSCGAVVVDGLFQASNLNS